MLISSSPSSLDTTNARSTPRRARAPAMRSRKAGSETPMSWRRAPGRIGQRPEEVEDGAHRELLAHRDDVARRLVVGGREHEAEAGLVDAARHRIGRQVDARAERLEDVGAARQAGGRAVAVLGQRAAGAGGDERGGGRDVERRAPPAGARGVHEVGALARHRRGERAHGARQPGQLVDRLALRAQPDEERGDLHLGGVAGHDLGQHRGRLLLGQVAARRERVDGPGQGVGGHQCGPTSRGSSPAAACPRR